MLNFIRKFFVYNRAAGDPVQEKKYSMMIDNTYWGAAFDKAVYSPDSNNDNYAGEPWTNHVHQAQPYIDRENQNR